MEFIMDIDALKLEEQDSELLEALARRVREAIAIAKEREKRIDLERSTQFFGGINLTPEQIENLLKVVDENITENISGTSTAKKSRRAGSVAPKYRNPENPSQEWSGRGKQAKWFKELLEKGYTKADLLIRD